MCEASFRVIFRGEKPKNEFRPAQNISIIAFYITSTFKVTYRGGDHDAARVHHCYLTLEDGSDSLSHNVGNYLPMFSA